MPTRSVPSRRPATSSIPPPPSGCSTISTRPAARAIRKTPMSPSAAVSRNPMRCCAAAACCKRRRRLEPGLDRQIVADRGQEEDRDVDHKADAPQDGPERRPVAEIGEDIGDPYDQEQHGQFIDETLRAAAELRQQYGDREKRKRLDAVLVRAQRPGPDRILVESRVARVGVVAVSYTHLRAHETGRNLVCRLLLE